MNSHLLVTPDPELTKGRTLKIVEGLTALAEATEEGWDLVCFVSDDDPGRWQLLLSRPRLVGDKKADERRRAVATAFFAGAVAMTAQGKIEPVERAEEVRVLAWEYAKKKIPVGSTPTPLPPKGKAS